MTIIEQHLAEAHGLLTVVMQDPKFVEAVEQATQIMINALRSGGGIYSCGNGGSMCDAMHFAEELSGRYRDDRAAYRAMSISDPSHLSCVGNDYGYERVFSRFIEAMGKPGDVLLAISTSGNSRNVIAAAKAAQHIGMMVVGLTGKNGGELSTLCNVEVRVPWSGYADRIQEVHIKIIHSLIAGIEVGMLASEKR
jgi:D-sedoheptulose 7-phosphate isomerase